MNSRTPPQPYAARVRADLMTLKGQLNALLDLSTIKYVNPNAPDRGVVFVTAADWGWGPGDEATIAAQMDLIGQYSAWFDRFLLLFPNPTPDIERKIKKVDDFIRRWVTRNGTFDHSIPRTIQEAKEIAGRRLAEFDHLIALAARQGDATLRLVPDTNALLRNPAVEDYASVVDARKFMVHIVTTVLKELDDLKDRGRTPDVREKLRRSFGASRASGTAAASPRA